MRAILGVAMAIGLAGTAAAEDGLFADFAGQQQAMAAGEASSESLVRAYLARIAALDRQGPRLNSVIALNPNALADARRLDAERRAGKVRGPLHGLPILIKDNIDSADGTATTAGSLALKDNITGRDAPLVARLKDAGAVILGKTNLSEWANYRSTRSISGWSAVGGLVRNPHALDRSACGSSSGSGAAVAAALASGAVGTETDGSITCPAAMNGVVGLKPTVGLVSRTHVVPISASQDTAGPMTRNVADAAAMLQALAGTDPADPATAEVDRRKGDYVAALRPDALKGARIGVIRDPLDPTADRTAAGYLAGRVVFDRAVADLRRLAVEAGRGPDHVKAFVGAEVVVAPTQAEAEDKVALLQEHRDLEGHLVLFSGWAGIDLSGDDTDAFLEYKAGDAMQTFERMWSEGEDRKKVGELVQHLSRPENDNRFIAGTPEQVADRLEEFIDTTDADGINLIQHLSPGTFVDFVDLVVPELQRRGRYRTAYTPGETLRERLFGEGNSRPLPGHPSNAFRAADLNQPVG